MKRGLQLAGAVVLWLGLGETLWAQGQVRLEVFTDERVPVTASQDWLRALSTAGVESVRIAGKAPAAKVGIASEGSEQNRTYVVTGMIATSGELVLPGGRYKTSDAAQVAAWIKDVAAKGPPDRREKTTSMGLTLKQFEAVHEALAPAVGFSTKGMDRAEAAKKIAEKLAVRVHINPDVLKPAEGDKIAEELTDVSSGTGLSYVLRPAGLCLIAKGGAAGPELAIAAAKPGMELWPVGWKPEEPEPKVCPGLFQIFNANLQDVAVTTVFEAIGPRMKATILLDHNALARHGIDAEKTTVTFNKPKVSYYTLLRAVCSQAKLRMEIRIDEAGKPLVWVTTMKSL
jgi:hypothetical protein